MKESRTFNNTGEDFSGYNAAVAFLKERGFSVGEMQTGSPTGVYFGECKIGKYRSLDAEDKSDLHGLIQALPSHDFRRRDVEVVIRGNVKSDVMEAFRDKPDPETMPIVGLEEKTDNGMTIEAEDVAARLYVEGFNPQSIMVDP